MFKNLLKNFIVEDLAIDLTSTRTVIYQKGQGIKVNEPSVVVVEDGMYIAVGNAAEEIRGKSPEGVDVIKPIKDGVIAEPDYCEQMLRHAMQNIYPKNNFLRFYPSILAVIPHHSSAAERKIFEETLDAAGAKDVHLISSLIAAAYGAELKADSCSASIICNISHSFTEIGIVSLNKIHSATRVAVGYDDFVKAVVSYVRSNTLFTIGDKAAERAIQHLGCAYYIPEEDNNEYVIVSGMQKRSSVPIDVQLSKKEVHEILTPSINAILHGMLEVLEKAKDDMAPDLKQNGITILGCGATLSRIDRAFSEGLEIKTSVVKNPATCIAEGAGKIIEKRK